MSLLADWYSANAANILLIPHILLILYGAILFSPLGKKIADLTKNYIKGNRSPRERMINGMLFSVLGGFTVSSHTYWIHQRISSQGSSFCSGSGLFSCGDVIGHEKYGYAPIIGIPWGLIGMGVFLVLLYMLLVLKNEPDSRLESKKGKKVTRNDAKSKPELVTMLGLLLTGGGIPVIGLLIYYETQIHKICQYCSVAHIANVVVLVMFAVVFTKLKDDNWNSLSEIDIGVENNG